MDGWMDGYTVQCPGRATKYSVYKVATQRPLDNLAGNGKGALGPFRRQIPPWAEWLARVNRPQEPKGSRHHFL